MPIKTLSFLRDPTAKLKPQFDGNFVESQAKVRSLKLKLKFQVSIKETESKRF